jgi:class 3 adenylate cyclase
VTPTGPTSSTQVPRGFSLRTRWTAALLITALVPITLLGWFTIRTVRTGLVGIERNLQATVLDRIAYAITTEIDYVGEVAHRVGQVLIDDAVGDPAHRVAFARDTMARAPAILHIAVYTNRGERADTIQRTARNNETPPTGATPLDRVPASLLEHVPEQGVWLAPEFTPQGLALRYAEPVRNDEQLLCWVIATLHANWLATLTQQISYERYSERNRLVVVDERLRLLVPGTVPVGTSLAERDIFEHADILRHGENLTFTLTRDYTDQGVDMVGTLQAYRYLRWFIAVRRPESEAYASLTRALRIAGIGSLASIMVAMLLGTWLARHTTHPIGELVKLTESYAARRFADRSPVHTGDELETLGRSLEGMADKLQESEAEIARRARIENNLARFLPSEVAKAVARGEQSLALGGTRREVTVLFADVASFTGFSESAPPERVVTFLNEIFTVLTEVVFRHGGMVDKFMGDCVMAVFGTGSDPRDEATEGADMPVARALAAAEDIHRFVEASAPAWKETYGIDVRLGIGINRGEALVGNLGSESRMEYTVIGDTVNIAARLESLARGGQTLVTGAVVRVVGRGFSFSPLGEHPIRGKREPVEIFEVTS